MSDSVQPHRRQPTRLPRSWDSPGKDTGVGCHFLLQCMKVKSESEVAQSCPTRATPWTVAYQAPPSMGCSWQESWSGVPSPSPSLILGWSILHYGKNLYFLTTYFMAYKLIIYAGPILINIICILCFPDGLDSQISVSSIFKPITVLCHSNCSSNISQVRSLAHCFINWIIIVAVSSLSHVQLFCDPHGL